MLVFIVVQWLDNIFFETLLNKEHIMEAFTTVSFPILVGVFAMSLTNVARRFIAKSNGLSPLQLLIHLFGGISLSFCLIYLGRWGFTMPQLLPGFWRAVLLGVLVNLVIQYCSTKAASIKEGEVSLTAPLFAMTPGLITILAITLGEYPSKIGIAGIFLISMGSYILMFEKVPQYWWEYLGPLKRLSLLCKIRHLSAAEKGKTIVVLLSLCSAVLGTFGLLFDGLYVRRGINQQGLTLAMIVLMGLLNLGYGIWYLLAPDYSTESQKYSFGFSFYREHPRYILAMASMVLLWLVMMYTFQPTYNHTYVAYVGTLKRLSVLTSVIMGYLFFKEGEFTKRIGAATFIVLGAILISLDDLPTRISTQMEILGL